MKSNDQILLENAYKAISENIEKKKWHVVYDEIPDNIGYSNRTFNVRGQEVLLKIEWDQDEDSRWNYLSFVDPTTKERVFKDMSEDEIKAHLKQYQYE